MFFDRIGRSKFRVGFISPQREPTSGSAECRAFREYGEALALALHAPGIKCRLFQSAIACDREHRSVSSTRRRLKSRAMCAYVRSGRFLTRFLAISERYNAKPTGCPTCRRRRSRQQGENKCVRVISARRDSEMRISRKFANLLPAKRKIQDVRLSVQLAKRDHEFYLG